MILLAPLFLLATPANITVRDQNGSPVAPFALKPSRPTVLIYIVAECPISAKYSPEIGRLVHTNPGVRFFLVHTDQQATPTQAKAHQKQFAIPCPELLDTKHELVKLGRPDTVPTAVLFDARGHLKYKGRIDDRFPELGTELAKPRRRDLQIAIEETLANKAVSVPYTPAIGCALPPERG